MRRLLVTGGAGFIGCNFVHHWLIEHPGDRVVVLDALTYAGNLANLDRVKARQEFRFVHGNICDTALVENLLREEMLDVIVHFAAESHVDRSIAVPDAFIETNVIGKAFNTGDNGVDNQKLIAVNQSIQSHPVEVIGRELRGYMVAMKKVAVGG